MCQLPSHKLIGLEKDGDVCYCLRIATAVNPGSQGAATFMPLRFTLGRPFQEPVFRAAGRTIGLCVVLCLLTEQLRQLRFFIATCPNRDRCGQVPTEDGLIVTRREEVPK